MEVIDFIGAPGEARTPGLLIRSLTGLGYIIDSFRGGHLVSPSPAASSALIEPEIEHAFRALSNAVIPSPMVLSGAADRLALLPRVCAAEIEQKPLSLADFSQISEIPDRDIVHQARVPSSCHLYMRPNSV